MHRQTHRETVVMVREGPAQPAPPHKPPYPAESARRRDHTRHAAQARDLHRGPRGCSGPRVALEFCSL